MSKSAAIVNFGMGNIQSIVNALEVLECKVTVLNDPRGLADAERILLPGVGAFGDAMQHLRDGNWIEPLENEVLKKKKLFLGICLGLQILATIGTEHGNYKGLNWIPGRVSRIQVDPSSLRIPHVGWNDVRPKNNDNLYAGLDKVPTFYFVHSYVFYPDDPGVVNGICHYGTDFTASLACGNVMATQYHPEKSQKAGLGVLKNFLNMKN